MKRIVTTAISALTLVCAQGTANAKMVVPSGSTILAGTINATVFGTNLTCLVNLTLIATPNHGGDAHSTFPHTDIPTGGFSVQSVTVSGPGGCSLVYGVFLNWSIDFPGPDRDGVTTLRVNDINIPSFVPGVSCKGNVQAVWNNYTLTLFIPSQTIPAFPLGTCAFSGSLISPALEIRP